MESVTSNRTPQNSTCSRIVKKKMAAKDKLDVTPNGRSGRKALLQESGLRLRRIPEITFEINDLGIGHEIGIDVALIERL